jgi:PAS domain S-box-containing protein
VLVCSELALAGDPGGLGVALAVVTLALFPFPGLPADDARPDRGDPRDDAASAWPEAATLLAAIADSAEDAIISKTLDGTIQSWNPAAERMYGYAAREAIGQPIALIEPPERGQEVAEIHAGLARGETRQGFETVRVRKDGRRIHVSLTVAPLRDAAGRIVGGCQVERDITALKGGVAPISDASGNIVGAVGCSRDVSERKRAEVACRLSEEKFRAAFHANPAGIVLSRLADGCILDVNETFLELFGYAREDVLGHTSLDLGMWAYADERQRTVAELLGHGRLREREVTVATKTGQHRTVLLSAETIRVSEEPLLLALLLDITARKAAEEERRGLALFPAQSPDPILRVARTGRLLYANPPSGPLLRAWGATVGDQLAVPDREPLLAPLRTGEPHQVRVMAEGRAYSLASVPFPELGYVNVYGRDITGHEAADAALAEQKAFAEAVVEEAADPIVVVDAGGLILLANSAARRLYGLDPRGQAFGTIMAQLGVVRDSEGRVVPLERRAILCALRGETVVGRHQTLERPDGSRYEYLISAAPIHLRGTRIGAVATLTDITVERATQLRLREALADKDTLLMEVHHRTKNNLQMLCSLLELQADAIQSPEGKAALELSATRIYAIARLYEQLYRAMTGGQVVLCEYLRGLAEHFQTTYGRHGIRVIVPPLNGVFLDVDRAIPCGLIVNELLMNAVKHAFGPGAEGTVGIEVRRAGDMVQLRVWDTGRGLPRGLNIETSNSLGLRLVRILAQRLRADLCIEGGAGARFLLTFPAQE